jgi:hypothetical protein
VIAFVGDHLGGVIGRWRKVESFEVGCRPFEGGLEGLRVAGVAGMNLGCQDRAGVEIDRVLGLVGQPGATVLKPRDPRLRIGRALPVGIRDPLAGAGPVELAELVGVAIPLLRASSASMACQSTPSARRTIERIAAFASMVEASTPTRLPLTRPCPAMSRSTRANTASWSSSGSRARVRDSVLWSGTVSLVASFRKRRSERLSAQRQAIPRSLPRPSK